MKIVLHIIGKDIRELRWEIAATVAVTLATALLELPGRFSTLKDLGQFWSQPAVVLAWILLVLRVVQSDGLVGTEHDWLTRPVRRWQLAAAKTLFVVLFVVAPLAIRDAIIVSANGFPVLGYLPGLAWSVAILSGVFLLPAAALGVVTRTIPQALMGVLGLILAVGLADFRRMTWVGVDWVPLGLAGLMGAVVAVLVIWVQYSRRWTARARGLAVAGVVVALVLPGVLPWEAAFFCQRLFATENVDASRMEVRLAATMVFTTRRRPVKDGEALLEFPILVTGAPPGYKVRVLRVDAMPDPGVETVQDGFRRNYAQPDGTVVYGLKVKMRESEFVPRQEEPTRLCGRVYLAVLAPKAKREFTYEHQRQMVPGVGVCEASFERVPYFNCSTPFRTPTETRVTFRAAEPQAGAATAALSTLSSLSPIPFEFSLAPMRGAAAAINRLDYSGELPAAAGMAGGRIIYETWAPVAYIEREFELVGQSLGDYRSPFQ